MREVASGPRNCCAGTTHPSRAKHGLIGARNHGVHLGAWSCIHAVTSAACARGMRLLHAQWTERADGVLSASVRAEHRGGSPHQGCWDAEWRSSTLEAAGRLAGQVGGEDHGAVPEDRPHATSCGGQRPRLQVIKNLG